MRAKTVFSLLPDFLWPTHRILQRYVASVGANLPPEQWRELKRSLPEGFAAGVAGAIDRIVTRSPDLIRETLRIVYQTLGTFEERAEGASLPPEGLQQAWITCLVWMRAELRKTGNATLLQILETPMRTGASASRSAGQIRRRRNEVVDKLADSAAAQRGVKQACLQRWQLALSLVLMRNMTAEGPAR